MATQELGEEGLEVKRLKDISNLKITSQTYHTCHNVVILDRIQVFVLPTFSFWDTVSEKAGGKSAVQSKSVRLNCDVVETDGKVQAVDEIQKSGQQTLMKRNIQ